MDFRFPQDVLKHNLDEKREVIVIIIIIIIIIIIMHYGLSNCRVKFEKYQTTLNPLQTKRRPLYLKTQSVPRCKHFSSRL